MVVEEAEMIPVFRPSHTDEEIRAVSETIKSGWWGCGPEVKKFEDEFSSYVGAEHAVALNSCTAALHLSGKILDLKSGSEVVTSPLTFMSTAFIALYNNLKIVFADVEADTLNMDPADLETKITEKTGIIVPVHYGGHACDMDAILGIAREKGIFVVEDAAHATGSTYKDRKAGTLGDMGCFSFQAVKNLATGDGGMLVTNSKKFADRARKLRWLGINKETSARTKKDEYSWKYLIDELGYKYQMSDILAAIGRVQLGRVEEMNSRRRELTEKYNDAFRDVDWIETPVEKSYTHSSNHNYVIKVENRDRLIDYLKEKGISTGVHYMPLYKHPLFSKSGADCPVAEKVWKKLITLPLFPDMTEEEIAYIIKHVKYFKG